MRGYSCANLQYGSFVHGFVKAFFCIAMPILSWAFHFLCSMDGPDIVCRCHVWHCPSELKVLRSMMRCSLPYVQAAVRATAHAALEPVMGLFTREFLCFFRSPVPGWLLEYRHANLFLGCSLLVLNVWDYYVSLFLFIINT